MLCVKTDEGRRNQLVIIFYIPLLKSIHQDYSDDYDDEDLRLLLLMLQSTEVDDL